MKKKNFAVGNMHCAGCARTVETLAAKVPGVCKAFVNIATGRLTLELDDSADTSAITAKLTAAITPRGYTLTDLDSPSAISSNAASTEKNKRMEEFSFAIACTACILLMLVAMGPMIFPALALPHTLNICLQLVFTAVIVVAGRNIYGNGFLSLIQRSPNMNSLIAVGTTAAVAYSVYLLVSGESHLYFDTAGMIVTLILLGRLLEAGAKRKTSAAIRSLIQLVPRTATVVRQGKEETIPVSELRSGDIIRIRPGERLPADGIITEGMSALDESMLTGESIPVEKEPGARVVAASLNTNGSFLYQAQEVGAKTVLAGIVRLLEDAQGSRPPIARLADQVSAVFVPVVLCLGIVTFSAWLIAGAGMAQALSFGLAVLVVACPCALGLATPTALIVGIGRGATAGVLIKSGAALECTAKIQTLIFDKTGTLTQGKIELEEITVFDPSMTVDQVLAIAAALEQASEHPIGKAIVAAATEKKLSLPRTAAFAALPGYGATAEVDDDNYLIGNVRLLTEFQVMGIKQAAEMASHGTVVFLATYNTLLAAFSIADRVKPEAVTVVTTLKNRGIHPVMLTGDNFHTARKIGELCGISEIYAGLLPEEKVKKVAQLTSEAGISAMVGDGINDAPALARASVGIAIGSGTDVAMEAADIVLVSGKLDGIVNAIELSRATLRIIRQNLFWAFFYNAIGIPVAAGILTVWGGPALSPVLGACAMAMSSICVVSNALRLRRCKLTHYSD